MLLGWENIWKSLQHELKVGTLHSLHEILNTLLCCPNHTHSTTSRIWLQFTTLDGSLILACIIKHIIMKLYKIGKSFSVGTFLVYSGTISKSMVTV